MSTHFKQIALLSLALACASAISPITATAQTVATVIVPDHCTATAINGTARAYANGQFLGICALVAAKEQGAVSSFQLLFDDAFGFYMQTLNGTAPSSTQYWALYKNNAYSDDGLSTMVVARGDKVSFQLTDWTDNSTIGSPIEFNINLFVSVPVAPAATGGSLTLHAPFDVPLALAFLEKDQRADGSFDSILLSDWTAIAFAVGGAGDARKKLAQHFIANPPELESITDYERHAMALLALGINPYSGTPVDYVTPIIKSFDGRQIGDTALVNDDIFAVFPLFHAGYSAGDEILQKIVAFIVSRQSANGSWENSVDLTAAAVQALSLADRLPDVSSVITRAANYIRAEQQPDGGFGNSFGTSWVLQAIAAVPNSGISWEKGYFTPQYYLATLQQNDGGVEPASESTATRLWATAYAIPAIKGKTWDSLLSSFEKPVIAAPKVEEPATTTATSPIVPALSELSDELKEMTIVEVQQREQAVFAEQVQDDAPVPETAASTTATTTLTRISLAYVQTAAVADAVTGTSTNAKPIAAMTLSIVLLGTVFLFSKYRLLHR